MSSNNAPRRSKWDQSPASQVNEGIHLGNHFASSIIPETGSTNSAAFPAAVDQSLHHQQVAAEKANQFLESKMAFVLGGSTDGGTRPHQAAQGEQAAKFSAELNINSCRPETRYHLTSNETFDSIQRETGATIKQRGTFMHSETTAALENPNPEDRPLHLYITGDSQESVDQAYQKLKTLMERPAMTPSGLLMIKVYIPFAADADPAFSLQAKIIGPKGSYVKHIQSHSNCKVHLRGKGSSYIEANLRSEAPEPLHLFITGATEAQVNIAKDLSEKLIKNVKDKYDAFLADKKAGVPAPPSGIPASSHTRDSRPLYQSNTSSHTSFHQSPIHQPNYQSPAPPTSMYDPFASHGAPPSNALTTSPRHSGDSPSRSHTHHHQTNLQSSHLNAPNFQGRSPSHPFAPSAPTPPSSSSDQPSNLGSNVPSYNAWTPEAIVAYYAYYGYQVPQQYAVAMAQSTTSTPVNQAIAPPPPPTNVPVPEDAVDMDMSDDEDSAPAVTSSKRSNITTQVEVPPAKRPKFAELSDTPSSLSSVTVPSVSSPEDGLSGAGRPFWAANSANRDPVFPPHMRS